MGPLTDGWKCGNPNVTKSMIKRGGGGRHFYKFPTGVKCFGYAYSENLTVVAKYLKTLAYLCRYAIIIFGLHWLSLTVIIL